MWVHTLAADGAPPADAPEPGGAGADAAANLVLAAASRKTAQEVRKAWLLHTHTCACA